MLQEETVKFLNFHTSFLSVENLVQDLAVEKLSDALINCCFILKLETSNVAFLQYLQCYTVIILQTPMV